MVQNIWWQRVARQDVVRGGQLVEADVPQGVAGEVRRGVSGGTSVGEGGKCRVLYGLMWGGALAWTQLKAHA